jgi:aerobic carbon-monoxide dehydrogenase large subunit
MGQGTRTMLAQIVGENLGRDIDNVTVTTGDTSGHLGFGGFNSRQTVVAGSSAHAASLSVRRKLLRVASHLLDVPEGDLDVVGDQVISRSSDNLRRSFRELAAAAAGLPGFPLPGIDTPGLEATEYVVINDMAYSSGTAVAEVEVDEETGRVRVVTFTLAHDCGRIVNPMMVDGQVMGGIAHGLGNALFEHMRFDDEAQPLSTTLGDYLLVSASEMPATRLVHRESASPLNPLGVKGVGESGVIPTAAAVLSAVDDALRDFDLHANAAPLSPQLLRSLLKAARPGAEAAASRRAAVPA